MRCTETNRSDVSAAYYRNENRKMSKYCKLWEYVQERPEDAFILSFDEIEEKAGIPIDHLFLTYKKELNEYGWKVGKISMKEQTVKFEKC